MLFQIKTINGQKTIVPLTADTGTGAPVGSLIAMYKKSSPSGYLYCDGSTFDETAYPALYQYLGSNVLPDYREFALVGAEENTTDVYNASTNPTGTIHDHDVYTEGQAKDDQLQQHRHYAEQMPVTGGSAVNVAFSGTSQNLTLGNVTNSYRNGGVTRGKRKAVYFYIKATSGLTENQQENVLNTINENLSYSTTEHKTGKKWIDGKDIYAITITGLSFGETANAWTNSGATLSNCDTLINGIVLRATDNAVLKNIDFRVSGNNVQYYTNLDFPNCNKMTLEYTKTT